MEAAAAEPVQFEPGVQPLRWVALFDLA